VLTEEGKDGDNDESSDSLSLSSNDRDEGAAQQPVA
jgi:hypothetical protein